MPSSDEPSFLYKIGVVVLAIVTVFAFFATGVLVFATVYLQWWLTHLPK